MIDFISDNLNNNNIDENAVMQILNSAIDVLQYYIDKKNRNLNFDHKKLEDEIMDLIIQENLLYDLIHHAIISNQTTKSNVEYIYTQIKEIRMEKYFQYLSRKNI